MTEGDALIATVTAGRLPRERYVAGGAGWLRCLVFGDDDAPAVLCVHGNGGHALWWAPLVPVLVPGWRVIAPDLRGHGGSDRAEPPAYRLGDFARDLEAVCAALAPAPLAVVGHSMGGRVALWHAAHHSDRVRGLALLDTRFDTVDAALVARYRGRVAGAREGRGYPTRAAAIAAFRFVPDEAGVPTEVVAMLAYHAVHERARGDWAFRFDRAVLSLDGDGAGDLYPLLERVRCPAWVAGGESSWVLDAPGRARIAARMASCTTAAFPGGHHFLLARAAAVGAALRRFLDALA